MKSKVKQLEYELGRWKKKVEDQQNEIKRLNARLDTALAGANELQRAADMILAVVVERYGQSVGHGMPPIKRLTLRCEEVRACAGYAVSATRDISGEGYILEAIPPEEKGLPKAPAAGREEKDGG